MNRNTKKWVLLFVSALLLLSLLTGCFMAPEAEPETNQNINENENNGGSENSSAGTNDDKENRDQENSSDDTNDDIEPDGTENSFESMSDVEKACYLWNNEQKQYSSCTAEMEFVGQGEMQGLPFAYSGRGMLYMNKTGGKVFYYEDMVAQLNVNNGNYVQDVAMQSGYADGKMFSYQKIGDGEGEGVYSVLSDREWLDYFNERYETTNLKLSNKMANSITLTETQTGGYKVTASSFSKNGLAAMQGVYGNLASVMGGNPIDIELDFEVDANKRLKSAEICFLYESNQGEEASSLVIRAEYRDFNKTEPFAVSMSGYRNVGDLRVIERVETVINKLNAATNASLECYEACVILLDGQTMSKDEVTIEVNYSDGNGGYTFVVEDSEGNKVRYKNGKQYITQAGQPEQEQACDELSAKLYIENHYVAFAPLDSYNVANVTKNGKEYCIALEEVDLERFSPILEALSVTENEVKSAQGNVFVQVTNGKLISLDYEVLLEIDCAQGTVSVEYVKQIQSIQYTA